MLLDSNIISYSAKAEYSYLRRFIAENAPAVSVISYTEVLGYHELSESDRSVLLRLFDATDVLPLSDDAVDWAVRLRQQRRMTLGDATIAGTALAYGHELVTHNVRDLIG